MSWLRFVNPPPPWIDAGVSPCHPVTNRQALTTYIVTTASLVAPRFPQFVIQTQHYTSTRHDTWLKGQCREIFCFWFFSWINFHPAPEYPIWTVSNFFKNSRKYSLIKVHHRYQRHRRKICHRRKIWNNYQTADNVKWTWKKIYLYANSTTQRCPKETIKNFLIEDFFHLPPVSTTLVVHLELRISLWIFKKFITLKWYNRCLGETDPCRKREVENLVALSL